ncbi:unnamed protein product [Closterium sp. NIES-54]
MAPSGARAQPPLVARRGALGGLCCPHFITRRGALEGPCAAPSLPSPVEAPSGARALPLLQLADRPCSPRAAPAAREPPLPPPVIVQLRGGGYGGGGCASSLAPPPPLSPIAASAAEGGGCVGAEGVVLGGCRGSGARGAARAPVVRGSAAGSSESLLHLSPVGPLLLPLRVSRRASYSCSPGPLLRRVVLGGYGRTLTRYSTSSLIPMVLQRFDFQYSSPQLTPLSTSHSLSAPPSDESVEPTGPYPELVGCLMHRKVHWDAAKRVLRYLCSTSGMGLVLGGRGPVVLTGHADASWVDNSATQRSSQGYTFSLGSSSISWRSTCSSSVLSSSCEAEIYARAMTAQELCWLTYLLTDLGEQPRSPPVLYVDNKAMIALCREHRLEHKTKHIALRYFLARELQQRGQLRLAYVATRANTADVFTKALPPGDHQHFATVLGLVPTLPHLLTT